MEDRSRKFYSELAEIYDQLFPVEDETFRFLQSWLTGPDRRVLDLACGTGLYTDALAAAGTDVRGVDGSPDLIAIGRRRSPNPDRLDVLDMTAIAGYPHAPLGLVFCIGNSLPHLGSVTDVRKVLNDVANLLGPAGVFVLQYVETENLPVGETKVLPTLAAGPVQFERRYVRATADTTRFEARLVNGGVHEMENVLLVFRSDEVSTWLRAAGFVDITVSGGFGGQSVDDSWVRVVTARSGTA